VECGFEKVISKILIGEAVGRYREDEMNFERNVMYTARCIRLGSLTVQAGVVSQDKLPTASLYANEDICLSFFNSS
jgi:hypothetical protein